jgi:hypothetical protein
MTDGAFLDPRKIAAVVYDDGVAVDELLLVFARDLVQRGVRVGGVVQLPRAGTGCGPEALMRVQDMATGDVFPICRRETLDPGDCSFDPTRLWHAARRVRSAIAARVDLVFVSRFGRTEARGGGLRPELIRAVAVGQPVLTAVRRGMIDSWLGVAQGVGTVLDAHLWVLEHWWNEIHGRRECPPAPVAA